MVGRAVVNLDVRPLASVVVADVRMQLALLLHSGALGNPAKITDSIFALSSCGCSRQFRIVSGADSSIECHRDGVCAAHTCVVVLFAPRRGHHHPRHLGIDPPPPAASAASAAQLPPPLGPPLRPGSVSLSRASCVRLETDGDALTVCNGMAVRAVKSPTVHS